MTEPAPAQQSAAARFVGLILVSIGVLWLVLTGLCTAGALVSIASEGNLGDIGMILVFALPSAMIGGALYFGGRLLRPRQ